MNAALQADFGCAALPGLDRASCDLLERKIVGSAAQVLAELALRECAEAARIAADVCVIDVAIDDVVDDVPARPGAQRIGGGADLVDLRSARSKQADEVVRLKPVAGRGAVEQIAQSVRSGRDGAAIG